MENSKNENFDPKEFLGARICSPLEQEKYFSNTAEGFDRTTERETSTDDLV